jgi:curved DNA-binding protein CbpA
MEIKAAYRKSALTLHPDRHDGCKDKANAFKEASAAYDILGNNDRRRDYDMATGFTPSGWYNKNRRRPPPVNYRKVYAPHAPPDGKWHDAQRHYDMHYGDGMERESIKNAYDRAKMNGEFEYHSPLGKGFTFESFDDRKSEQGQNSYYKNPYSKDLQGPPTTRFNYVEGSTMSKERNEAKFVQKRQRTVVDKLHDRRKGRVDKEKKEEPAPIFKGQKVYPQYNQESNEACVLM